MADGNKQEVHLLDWWKQQEGLQAMAKNKEEREEEHQDKITAIETASVSDGHSCS
jgi:hypothetical protein